MSSGEPSPPPTIRKLDHVNNANMNNTNKTSEVADDLTPKDHWEARYLEKDQVWSGRVNKVLDEIATSLTPGRSLDLGCGEGGDVVWLAQNGWDATGVDISETACERAAAAAAEAGLSTAAFVAADLETLGSSNENAPDENAPDESEPTKFKPESFELVTATFLHSFADLDRVGILQRATGLVAPGGHMLIISHAEPPPWAEHADHMREILKAPEDDLASLELDPASWQTVLLETRTRLATGPDGHEHPLDDGVILLQRR